MSRPHIMTTDSGYQPDTAAHLYVKRDTMTNLWRLAWMVPGDTCYVYAEGECSAHHFVRRWQAVAAGKRLYGEAAKNWPRD